MGAANSAQQADADGIGCSRSHVPQWRIGLGLALGLGFVDMLPAAIVDVSGCSQQWLGRRTARVYL